MWSAMRRRIIRGTAGNVVCLKKKNRLPLQADGFKLSVYDLK